MNLQGCWNVAMGLKGWRPDTMSLESYHDAMSLEDCFKSP